MNQRKAFTLIELLVGIAIHSYHNDRNRIPRGGKMYGRYPVDTQRDQGNWIVYLLPHMEQGALWNAMKSQLGSTASSMCQRPNGTSGECSLTDIQRNYGYPYDLGEIPSPSYLRCPSDNWDWNKKPSLTDIKNGNSTNYAGSLGPQCLNFFNCQYVPPHAINCDRPEWGYYPSPGCGQTWETGTARSRWDPAGKYGPPVYEGSIRGIFNGFCDNNTGLGMEIGFKQVSDGLSQTIFVGEVRPGCHMYLAGGNWMLSTSGNHWVSTIVPINYDSCLQEPAINPAEGCVNPQNSGFLPIEDQMRSWNNWYLSWGFKSRHPGGANFLFGDGSVHFLREEINEEAYNKLGCRDDGDVVPHVED